MITDLPTKRIKRYHSDKHFSEFLPTRWRQKSTGIDIGQNYVTVTLCIKEVNTWETLRMYDSVQLYCASAEPTVVSSSHL